jgi:hypothetical protein
MYARMVIFLGNGMPDAINLRNSGVKGPRTGQKRSG